MLLFTPFFIRKLGTDQYGIWMLVNSIIASIGIVNVGLGDAAIKFISKYRALNDNVNINRIINTGLSLCLILLLIIVLLGLIASAAVWNFDLFGLGEINLSLASSAIQLGSFVFGLKQIEQFLLSIFKGYERYDNSSQASIVSKFIFLIAQVLTIYLGYGLVDLFMVGVFVSFIMVLAEFIFVKSRYRELSLNPSLKKETIKEIFSFSTWSWVQSVLSIVAGHIDRFIVIILAGPTFLAYYALASTVGSQVHSVLTASVSWVFPKVSGKTERNEDVNQLYYKMQLIIVVLGFTVFGILLAFENIIFKTWLGAETYSNSILLIKIFLYLALFNSLSIIPYYFMLGSNLIKFSTLFMFLSLVLTIGFMILGYQFWSTTGLAYGKLISSMLSIPILITFVHFKILSQTKTNPGYSIYLPVILFTISIYMFNLISIPVIIINIVLLIYLYKKIF